MSGHNSLKRGGLQGVDPMFAVFLLGSAFGLSSMNAIETIIYVRRYGLESLGLMMSMIIDACVITVSLGLLNYT